MVNYLRRAADLWGSPGVIYVCKICGFSIEFPDIVEDRARYFCKIRSHGRLILADDIND